MALKITWRWDQETEAIRLLDLLAEVENGFLAKYHFLILPRAITGQPAAIYLPNLNYPKRLRQQAGKVYEHIYFSCPDKLINQIIKLKPPFNFDQQKLTLAQTHWQKINPVFWQTLKNIFATNWPKTLEIRPTIFGTSGSFCRLKNRCIVYYRIDLPLSYLAEAIVSGMLIPQFKRQRSTWTQNEAITDWLIAGSRLKKLFPKFRPTLSVIKTRELGQIKQESQKYVKKLTGRTSTPIKFNLEAFTASENRLLTILQHNTNQAVSFEELAQAIWGQNGGERATNYALTKTIHRVRQKLARQGLDPTIIQACRKQGYMLVE